MPKVSEFQQAARLELVARVARTSTKETAADLGFSAQYVSDVVHERRPMSGKFAKALGFKRVIIFVPLEG